MKKHIINAHKKACPLPVIEAKTYIENLKADENVLLEILVDNEIACENLNKLANKKGLEYKYEKKGNFNYIVSIIIGENVQNNEEEEVISKENIVVVIDSDNMGQGDETLGKILIKGFVFALTEANTTPSTIILYNRGVFLSTQIEETIADLKKLEQKGTKILSCGTCLMHYKLDLKVGTVTNMYEIAETKLEATKIIKI